MINSKINIKCPECNKEITINVKTIETLQNKVKLLEAENKRLKDHELAGSINNQYQDIFKGMF